MFYRFKGNRQGFSILSCQNRINRITHPNSIIPWLNIQPLTPPLVAQQMPQDEGDMAEIWPQNFNQSNANFLQKF